MRLVVLSLLLLLAACAHDTYRVDEQGALHLPPTGRVALARGAMIEIGNATRTAVAYASLDGATIHGYLYAPADASGTGILLLPGGSVNKDQEERASLALTRLGATVLTIDQRGVGDTGGPFLSMGQDYVAWRHGELPTGHQLIADAVWGAAALRAQPGIGRLLIAGESMGGRAAAVAVRLSPDADGALLISTSGFGNAALPDADQQRFLRSIDPDANLPLVALPVAQIHGTNDTMIPIDVARASFARAPHARFWSVACGHGYCPAMDDALAQSLAWLAAGGP